MNNPSAESIPLTAASETMRATNVRRIESPGLISCLVLAGHVTWQLE
ncbi:hypothetical protein [Pseudomonas fluorescens]|jgi:hypothetical protein|nr:hypothetical protein [Pseudomonas fluorescens]